MRAARSDASLCESYSTCSQIALDHGIDDTERVRLLGRHGIAIDDHGERRLDAGKPRQTLRAAGARREAELDLRLADGGIGRRHAIVAAERDLEPATERLRAERGDDRFATSLDGRDDIAERRLVRRPGLAEHADVGAGDAARPATTQHDGGHRCVCIGLLDARNDGIGHAGAHGVDGWIVDGDDGYAVSEGVVCTGHVGPPWNFAHTRRGTGQARAETRRRAVSVRATSAMRLSSTRETDMTTAACIGMGLIGSSWAVAFARHADIVRVYDPSPRVATRASPTSIAPWPISARPASSRDPAAARLRIRLATSARGCGRRCGLRAGERHREPRLETGAAGPARQGDARPVRSSPAPPPRSHPPSS